MECSADIVLTLLAHRMIFKRREQGKPTSKSSSTVLAAQTGNTIGPCENPGCKAKKQSIYATKDCYWLGGGKEGQFPPNFRQKARANAATATCHEHKHFMLSAQIKDTSEISRVMFRDKVDGKAAALISKGFQSFRRGKIPTFIDSGASDTMYVSKDIFTEYKVMTPHLGDSAKATDGNFEIVGKGRVTQ
jgi:hypothetical protein